MLIIFLFLSLGIALGIFLRRFQNIAFVSKLITVSIVILLFLLGKSVGKNADIMQNLPTIGMQAFIITTAAIAGSVLMSMIVYKYFFAPRKVVKIKPAPEKVR